MSANDKLMVPSNQLPGSGLWLILTASPSWCSVEKEAVALNDEARISSCQYLAYPIHKDQGCTTTRTTFGTEGLAVKSRHHSVCPSLVGQLRLAVKLSVSDVRISDHTGQRYDTRLAYHPWPSSVWTSGRELSLCVSQTHRSVHLRYGALGQSGRQSTCTRSQRGTRNSQEGSVRIPARWSHLVS